MGLVAPSAIQSRLKGLKEKGHVTWKHGAARTIQVVDRISPKLAVKGIIHAKDGLVNLCSLESLKLHGLSIPPNAFALQMDGAIAEFQLQDKDWLILQLLDGRPIVQPRLATFKHGNHTVLGQIQLATSSTVDIQSIRAGLTVPVGAVQAIAVGMWRNWEAA